MNFRRRSLAFSLIATGLMSASTGANTLQLSQEGSGEVLIYPYYTVRNGTISLLSLVNGSTEGKAVRLRAREAIGGRTVAELNVFLSPIDVWTAAIVPTSDGATIISNDKSCTHPKISGSSTGLVFSSAGFASDGAAYTPYTPADRTREGYIELLEMATVPAFSVLGKDIMHVAGVPSCKLTGDASSATIQSTLAAPSGELVGSMSFINLNDGISVSYNATGIHGFWRTGPGAPVPAITAPVAPSTANPVSSPDLTSGGNTTITVTDKGKTYVSTFARSIDAVSALFMNSTISNEYAYTADSTISTALVILMPTKPYYVFDALRQPFQNLYVPALGTGACDDYSYTSVDREEFVRLGNDDYSATPRPPTQFCDTANVFGFTPNRTAFDSPRMQIQATVQAQGNSVAVAGKEGGYLEILSTKPSAQLIPISSSVLARSAATGELAWTPAAYTYFGLPMLGFAISVAKYNAGTPQQNFGNLNALTSRRRIE